MAFFEAYHLSSAVGFDRPIKTEIMKRQLLLPHTLRPAFSQLRFTLALFIICDLFAVVFVLSLYFNIIPSLPVR